MAEKIYWSVRETADKLGVTIPTLRFWVGEFEGYVKPQQSPVSNRIRYTAEDIRNLQHIRHLLKERGMTIEGARASMDKGGDVSDNRLQAISRLRGVHERLATMKRELDEIFKNLPRESPQ